MAENRAYSLEAKLWAGFSQWTIARLETLLADEGSRTDERGYAAWALAGWLAFQGSNWRRVVSLAAQSRAAACPKHLGPILLESDALQRERHFVEARRVLRRAMAEQLKAVDLHLAYANSWLDGADLRRLTWINRALLEGCLAALELKDSGRPLSLDNIMASDLCQLDVAVDPKVSVIVPLYNDRATVITALDSVLRQTWHNIEVLVVDDGSSDGSFELARAIADEDERVVLLRHATNCGAYAARNTGLARATGEFVTSHDADDWSHPQKLALQVKALLEAPDCQASVSCSVRCSSRLVFSQWRPQATWVHCNASSLMFRRHLVGSLGYWDTVSVGADAEFYYRILRVCGARAIKEVLPGIPLAFTRRRPDSLTQQSGTHLRSLYYGLRREYQESADDWHRQIQREGLTPLSAMPVGRPFPVPAVMLRKLPDEMVACLIVADFSADSPHADNVQSCLQHLSELAGPLALFHLPDVTRPALGRVSGTVRTLMRERGVMAVLPGQRVRCSCLLLWTHAGLTWPLDDPRQLRCWTRR
ncbi:MAG: glycosyltransferase family 2 protein [Candidatus Accumulibacter sp.]|uniref:Glycosyltransferase family 2 protein n=1 Tax=Candidatus Accumulibacter affinis TaxID=2954384 RepID=A0A935TCP8_9PROT|nr:glycosyltransferase family 2 protein [Candidatus Accumulibacter affinis]